MHVGLVIYGDLEHTSGGFRYDRNLVSHLERRGDTVDVISLPWRRYPRGILDSYSRRIRSRLDRDVDVLVQDGLCHPSLWRHTDRLQGPDSIVGLVHHLRSDFPGGGYRHLIRPVERRLVRPVERSLVRPVERRFLESVDGLLCTSEFTASRVRTLAPPVSNAPIAVAHPAGRVEGRACSSEEVADRSMDDPFRLVFIGTLIPRKDPKTLLSALGRFSSIRQDAEWHLTVVGDHETNPSYASSVVGMARNLGLEDRVDFTGQIADEGLASILARSHVCCVPSRYEAFGMAYLEAMEYGVVPIASSVGGATEFVDNGTNGLLVDPGDDEEIAHHLARLESDRKLLAELGTNALETAAEWPTWEETLDDTRTFLERCVDRPTRIGGVTS